jgi:hypothetical protein
LLANAYEQAGKARAARRARFNQGRLFYQGGVEALDRGDRRQAAQFFRWSLELAPGYRPAKRALEELRSTRKAGE